MSTAHIIGKYRVTDPTLNNNDTSQVRVDVNGKLLTSGAITGGAVASDSPDSGNPVKVGSKVNVTSPTFTDGDRADLQSDINGYLKMREQYAPVYENNTTGRAVVEHNYTVVRVTADGQIKASAGFVHSVNLSAIGTVVAGVITLYANTAESGTVVWSGTAQVAMNPVTVLLDTEVPTGIYVGYDGTVANVAVSVSIR